MARYSPGSSEGGASTLGGLTNISASADVLSASDKGRALIWDGTAYAPDNVGLSPHIVSQTPTAFTATGSATLTINGSYISSTCKLEIPAALGTVVSGPVITNSTSTTADATWTLNIAAIPDPAVSRTLTLTNGGHSSTGMDLTIHHGWTPSALMINPEDTWIQASDKPDGVTNGQSVSTLTPGSGNRGALVQANGAEQPTYYDSVARLNNQPGLTLSAGTWYTNGLYPTSNYLITPSSTAFTVAMCWAPASSGTPIATSKLGAHNSWMWYFNDNANTNSYLFVGGTSFGNANYPNTGTTTARRLILSGDATDWTLVEPVTGISRSGTIGSGTPSHEARTIIGGGDYHFAEMIIISGREMTAGEKTALNAYWLAKYG